MLDHRLYRHVRTNHTDGVTAFLRGNNKWWWLWSHCFVALVAFQFGISFKLDEACQPWYHGVIHHRHSVDLSTNPNQIHPDQESWMSIESDPNTTTNAYNIPYVSSVDDATMNCQMMQVIGWGLGYRKKHRWIIIASHLLDKNRHILWICGCGNDWFRLRPRTVDILSSSRDQQSQVGHQQLITEYQRRRADAGVAWVKTTLSCYDLVELELEGCDLDETARRTVDFYIRWNRRGRHFLLQSRDDRHNVRTKAIRRAETVERDYASRCCDFRCQSTFVRRLGLWSLILANISNDPSLCFGFLREQPHLVSRHS